MTKPTPAKRIGRLHTQNSTDAAWRARQAQVDADIEGLRRDAGIDQFADDIEASGVEPRKQIERLKTYLRRRRSGA
jgi:hypothetical protein